jgi:hypothetical protein
VRKFDDSPNFKVLRGNHPHLPVGPQDFMLLIVNLFVPGESLKVIESLFEHGDA